MRLGQWLTQHVRLSLCVRVRVRVRVCVRVRVHVRARVRLGQSLAQHVRLSLCVRVRVRVCVRVCVRVRVRASVRLGQSLAQHLLLSLHTLNFPKDVHEISCSVAPPVQAMDLRDANYLVAKNFCNTPGQLWDPYTALRFHAWQCSTSVSL